MPRVGEELSLALALLLVGRAAEVHTNDTAGLGPVTSADQRFADANGCSVTVLGCYWDKQWADCRYKTFPAQPSCTQPPSYQKARDLPYNLPGCFTDANHPSSLRSAPSPPPCDKNTITSEACAAACGQRMPR